jgi:hypothetical protein
VRKILVLARLRARVGAVFGDDVAKAAELLVRKTGELRGFMHRRVAQIRAGDEAVSQWLDQDLQVRVRASAQTEDHAILKIDFRKSSSTSSGPSRGPTEEIPLAARPDPRGKG